MRFMKNTIILLLLVIGLFQTNPLVYGQGESSRQYDDLLEKAESEGTVMVIVNLNLPAAFQPEGEIQGQNALEAQRERITSRQQELLGSLQADNVEAYAVYETIPAMALKVDQSALEALIESSLVSSIQEDVAVPYTLGSSTGVIGMPTVWGDGHEGSGQTVVILDTGIEANHSFFGGRVVTEACFSNAGGAGSHTSLCPNGSGSQTGSGAANANTSACLNGGSQLCNHGTHVAGIAAGNGSSFDGVARGANIIAIQVFTRFNSGNCAGSVCSYSSDQISALEYIYNTLRNNYSIASANMSLGGGYYTDQATCDANSSGTKAAIDNLRSVGIATVIAAGNDGWRNAMSSPGCISSAVGVASTTDADAVSSFSNMHQMVDLNAPGSSIQSSVTGGGYATYNGTSMAAPHVAGAWAVLKGIQPSASVDDILTALQSTGVNVADTRSGGSSTKPRIQVDAAVDGLAPPTQPDINVNPNNMSATLSAGQSSNQTLMIGNTGSSNLIWTINEELSMVHRPSLEISASPSGDMPQATPAESDDVTLEINTSDIPADEVVALDASAPAANVNLVLDDGSVNTNVGVTSGGQRQFLWLNRFTPSPSDYPFQLEEIHIFFSSGVGVDVNELIDIYVYQDTDGDGNPGTGATIAASFNNVPVVTLGAFSMYNLTTPLQLNGPGDILIGVVNRTAAANSGEYPAALDTTASQGRSWIGAYSGSPANPPSLPASGLWNTIDNVGYAGNWLIRGYGSTTDGSSACSNLSDIPWVSVSPSSGTTSASGSTSVNVSFNATGLAAGTYTGNLCINSNDPDESLVVVPLSLTVNSTPPTNTPTPTVTPTSTPPPSGTVDLALSPASVNTGVGQTFDVAIEVQAGNQQVDGAAGYLNFNPSHLEVVSIAPGNSLSLVITNNFDNSAGHVNFAAGSVSNLPSGTFTLATVTFEAKAQTNNSPITFNSAFPRLSDATFGGGTVLDDTTGGSVTIHNAVLNGSVTFQGRPTAPHARWAMPLDVSLTVPGNSTPAYQFSPTTDQSGDFSLTGMAAGTYEIRVKHSHTLQVMQTVTLAGTNTIDFGTLREGDANNDNQVTLVDFSILATTFGKCEGTTGFDGRADFNEDDCIALTDFSLLATNFGQAGQGQQATTSPQSSEGNGNGSVAMSISPAQSSIKPGDTFNVTVQLNADSQQVDGTQIGLNFDPAMLAVEEVMTGDKLALELANQFDNEAGTIQFAAGTLQDFPSGVIDVLDIQFRALQAGETTLAFDATADGAMGSNVTFAGASVLGEQVDGTVTVNEPTAVSIQELAAPATTGWLWVVAALGLTMLAGASIARRRR